MSGGRLVWRGGARVAVALAFDLDGPTGTAMLDGSIWRKPEYFTLGSYGPWRALPRILDLLVNEPGHPADVFARLTGGGSDA